MCAICFLQVSGSVNIQRGSLGCYIHLKELKSSARAGKTVNYKSGCGGQCSNHVCAVMFLTFNAHCILSQCNKVAF